MKRTQVQIPDPLYEDIKRIAERRDWSVSEVFRRAVEEYVAEVPELREEGGWVLPQPREMGEPKVAADRWRDLLADDEAGV
ncbi:MAG: ribbon-helix-helix protein, CopG family [Spirochaetota bacterium]